jgi:polyisoprenoid-binding protein YceI
MSRNRWTVGVVLALLGCGLALHAVSAQQFAQPARQVRVGDVDLVNSRVYMLVGKTGFGHEHGVVGQLQSGHILLGQPQNAGELVFDMKSFAADDDAARKYVGLKGSTDNNTRQQVNDNMLGAAVLNVARFATATYTIDSAQPLQPQPGDKVAYYLLKGTLTLAGVAQPVQLKCEVIPVGDAVRVRTGFLLKQTDYGIKPFSKAFGAVGVADEMKVYGELVIANK